MPPCLRKFCHLKTLNFRLLFYSKCIRIHSDLGAAGPLAPENVAFGELKKRYFRPFFKSKLISTPI